MAARRMRMAELSRLSGVPRETIHYYAREGLLPAPERAGKTSAYYGEAHLERLRVIRLLREEKYLPVAVIRRILEAGLEAALGADLDTLAEVFRFEASSGRGLPAPDQETLRVALELDLVGGEPVDPDDPAVRRVLGAVGQAVEMAGSARHLTLADMRASAPVVRRLVEEEASVFFDRVLEDGDVPGAVAALRAGRGAVARYLVAYRDLCLQRVVDELLVAVQSASTQILRTRALGLGEEQSARLGAESHRSALAARARQGDAAAANDWIWHCFALGSTKELASLPPAVQQLLRPRAKLLVAHARAERGLARADEVEAILARAQAFPLGEVLGAELALLEALDPSQHSGVLERAAPALHRLFGVDPGTDADPLASALAHLRRGLLGLSLPRALGRTLGAERDLRHAIAVVLSAPGRLHAAVRARIEGNARLALGRLWLASGRPAEASRELARARDVDPTGPLGLAVESATGGVPPEILAETPAPS